MKAFIVIVILLIGSLWYAKSNYDTKRLLEWSQANKQSSLSEKVEYYAGMYNYSSGSYANAAGAFEQLLKNHTTGHYAPDALFRLAMTHKELNQRRQAFDEFNKFIELYPNHQMADLAKKNAGFLR